MQSMRLLHKFFSKKLPKIHKLRLNNILEASSTLIKVNKLSLTSLGRGLSNKAQERSNIKKLDRLLGNEHLRKESIEFYKLMNEYVLPKEGRAWIHVDWSCICSTTNQYLLRASLTMKGRSFVLYEECHPKKKENNPTTHKRFLNRLRDVLPSNIHPIIVTDAGFRAPWFHHVRSLGWDFVGRLRSKNAVLLDSSNQWQLSHEFHAKATNKPTYHGHGVLTEKGKEPAHFVVYKGKSKNRHKWNKNGKPSRSGKSKRHAKANKEPWVLVTSLDSVENKPHIATNIYKKRMQIEENFRDTKCTRFGFGLNDSRSRSPERFQVLMLISAIAIFAAWLAGIFIRTKGEAAHYQAHSAKFHNVISIVFLGKQALKKGFRMGKRQFQNTLKLLTTINPIAQAEFEL